MKYLNRSIPFMAACVLLFSCTPENNTPAPTPTNTTLYYTPGANVGGVCVAVNVTQLQEVPIIGSIEINVPAAVAVFYDGSNYTSFVDAGTVNASDANESRNLGAQTNHTYVFEDYQSGSYTPWSPAITWAIGGSGSVSGFTHVNSSGMPSVSGVEIADGYTITITNGMSLYLGTTIYADTLYVNIAGSNNTQVTKRFAAGGGINSIDFTAAELSVLENSAQGIIQLAPCNFSVSNYNSKDYVFINEAVFNKTGVTIE